MSIRLLENAGSGTTGGAVNLGPNIQGLATPARRYAVYAFGTFGGASVTLQGRSRDGEPWVPLRDAPGGNAFAFTANDEGIIDLSAFEIRAVVSGGDGTTDITVDLV